MPMFVQEEGKGFQDLWRGIRFLANSQVLVGIPEGSGGNGGLTNVELAYLHTNGSPVNNIPPRPFLEPAIEEAKDDIAEQMLEAAKAAFAGDIDTAINRLHMAGIVGENATKGYFGSGDLAPNAPITVSGGWMRNKVSGKPVHVKGKGSAAPLIDTGSLRGSVTHIVET